MKHSIVLFTFLLFSTFIHSQNDEFMIFDLIISKSNFTSGEVYVQYEKEKTYFSKSSFEEQSGLSIPEKILYEIENSSGQSVQSKWCKDLLFSNFKNLLFENKECLTKEDVKRLFDEKGRQNVIAISQPIFDERKIHSIVSVSYIMYHGSAAGKSYFLKKVYGKWVVLDVYDYWIT